MTTNSSQSRGFTLVELIISVALFAVVSVIAASAYLNLVNLDRRTRATNDLTNNLTFVINSMATSMRTGTNYSCDGGTNGTDCASLVFDDQDNCKTTFILNNGGIWESQIPDPSLPRSSSDCSLNGRLTDPSITVAGLKFTVSGVGNDLGSYLQPQVIMSVHGTMNPGGGQPASSFTLETSSTERGIDLPSMP